MKRYVIRSQDIRWRCIKAIEDIDPDEKKQEVIIREHKNSRSVDAYIHLTLPTTPYV